MSETQTLRPLTFHAGGPTLWGTVVHGDISKAMFRRSPKVLEVDLETDPCDFDDPTFWRASQTRLITVRDTLNAETEMVRVDRGANPDRLRSILHSAQEVYFHHAMFDLTFLAADFDIWVKNPRCTKILAKMLRAVGALPIKSASLKPLLEFFLEVDTPAGEALSDWSAPELTSSQLEYALHDVLYLHRLYDLMEAELMTSSMSSLPMEIVAAHEQHLIWMIRSRMMGHTHVFEH